MDFLRKSDPSESWLIVNVDAQAVIMHGASLGVVLNCCFWSVFASCPSYDCVCYQDCKRRNLDLSQQQNFERY